MGKSEIALTTCAALGIDLEERAQGGGAWLFGSRAAGCELPSSDWDVLLIVPRETRRGRERIGDLDLVTVSCVAGARERWLGSELSAHVARYGELLLGSDDWVDAIAPELAAHRKLAKVRARIAAVSRAWESLTPNHRARWARDLRRDLQRGLALVDEQTVPPTHLLDAAWTASTRQERQALLARSCAAPTKELARAMCRQND
ncbi:MAG: nucleotidyltransferase domain-containing protein [Sandaracinaceae bacterium]|nr:nucleotidyltransferase domain-containing protein [Sandaracinaceae bacterium]